MNRDGKSRTVSRCAGLLCAGLLCACFCVIASGCGNPTRLVKIDSIPPGASIYVNGEKRGQTPDQVNIVFTNVEQRTIIQLVMAGKKPIFQTWTLPEVPEGKNFTLGDE